MGMIDLDFEALFSDEAGLSAKYKSQLYNPNLTPSTEPDKGEMEDYSLSWEEAWLPPRPVSTQTSRKKRRRLSIAKGCIDKQKEGQAWENLKRCITFISDEGGITTVETSETYDPLMDAARHGHHETVEQLLDSGGLDTEQLGSIDFDGTLIRGVTALWCAARAGHLEVVRQLVHHQANVNHTVPITGSTPLHVACTYGHLEVVQCLLEHHADINVTDHTNNTSLMAAAMEGHTGVVRVLLERGADPDVKSLGGATALHYAAEEGLVDIVRELVGRRAAVVEGEHGMTPLKLAAVRCKADVVEFLTEECDAKSRVEGLELLGASLANDEENYDLKKAFHYLHAAMTERCRDPRRPILKERLPHVEAYGPRRECESLEDLENIHEDQEALHLETLMIRERILGSDNIFVLDPLFYRGACFASSLKFDICMKLWLHALRLEQRYNRNSHNAMQRFVRIFFQMVRLHEPLDAVSVEQAMSCSVLEMERLISRVDSAAKKERPQARKDYRFNIFAFLLLSFISTKTTCGEEQRVQMNKHIYRMIKMDVRSEFDCTLLHQAVSSLTVVDGNYELCRFPDAQVVKLLLECGAQVNAVDKDGNTPLHIIAIHDQSVDFRTLHTIISSLVEADAHMDMATRFKRTPLDLCSTSEAKDLLRSQTNMSLQCLAARALRRHKIPFKKYLPKILWDFVQMH